MNIYFVAFLARPKVLEVDGQTGAYVNCWIKSTSAKSAQFQAETGLRESGWYVETIEQSASAVEVRPETESGAEFYDQAKIDGEVYVFHTWHGTDDEPVH